jgi:SpoVK/Ycf46/Vps4 family AAA+-type ATPase
LNTVQLDELAAATAGYCGADLKALCSEAALRAVRRRYPQIYSSNQKLVLDLTALHVSAADFHAALAGLTPASHRAGLGHFFFPAS